MTTEENKTEWIEVDNNGCFHSNERDGYHIVVLINHCKQLKRSVRRVRDSIEFIGYDQDEAEAKLVRYMERPNVRLVNAPDEPVGSGADSE